jgi:MarR family transcriptional regulator, negative regulator of the multidrug operon emrRAB
MDDSIDRLTNLAGALALAVTDRMRNATEAAAEHGAAAPAALVSLHEFLGRGSMEQLARAVGLSHSGAVRLVDRLALNGYVERRPCSDGRQVALVLTGRGHAAARRVLAARSAALKSVLGGLSPAERRSLTEIADKLIRSITRERLEERAQGRVPTGGWLCRLCDFEDCGRPDGACPAASTTQSLHG